MSGIEALLEGFRRFRETYFEENPVLFRDKLRHGQSPSIAVVACSDSRVDPAIVLQAEPGDIFAVRNVAALVPPYEEGGLYHGTSAALEFAIEGLGVSHVIVIGHAQCGGVAAMNVRQAGGPAPGRFLSAWTELLRAARERALAADPDLDGAALQAAAERQAVRLSLENLATFPFVRAALSAGELSLHGWYLNIYDGTLHAWTTGTETWERLG